MGEGNRGIFWAVMVCHDQGHCSLGCTEATETTLRITLARGWLPVNCPGSKRLFHLEELQQGNLKRSSFRNKKVGEHGGGGIEQRC